MWISIAALALSVLSIATNVWFFLLSGPRIRVDLIPGYRHDVRNIELWWSGHGPKSDFPVGRQIDMGEMRRSYRVIVRNRGRLPVDIMSVGLRREGDTGIIGHNEDNVPLPSRVDSSSALVWHARATTITFIYMLANAAREYMKERELNDKIVDDVGRCRLRAVAELSSGKVVVSRQTAPIFLPSTDDLDAAEFFQMLNNSASRSG